MAKGFLTALMIVIGLALMTVGAISLITEATPEEKACFLDAMKEDPLNGAKNVAIMGISYDLNSPYFQFPKWVPFTEERVFLLEDFPFPASWDALYLVPIILLTIFILKYTLLAGPNTPISRYLLAALIIFIVAIGAFCVVRIIAENALMNSSAEICLQNAAIEGRDKYSSTITERKEAVISTLLITLFGFIGYAKAMRSNSNND